MSDVSSLRLGQRRRSGRIVSIGVLLLVVNLQAGVSSRAEAPDDGRASCFEQVAKKCRRGDWIRVIDHDTAWVSGHLLSIYPEQLLLTMHTYIDGDTIPRSFEAVRVSEIQYKGGYRYSHVGAVVGAVVGLAYTWSAVSSGDDPAEFWLWSGSDESIIAGGIVFGAVIGYAAGTVYSMISPPTNTIRCREAADN